MGIRFPLLNMDEKFFIVVLKLEHTAYQNTCTQVVNLKVCFKSCFMEKFFKNTCQRNVMTLALGYSSQFTSVEVSAVVLLLESFQEPDELQEKLRKLLSN